MNVIPLNTDDLHRVVGGSSSQTQPAIEQSLFQGKARMSEAKSSLSHMFTLEISYYSELDSFRMPDSTLNFSRP